MKEKQATIVIKTHQVITETVNRTIYLMAVCRRLGLNFKRNCREVQGGH